MFLFQIPADRRHLFVVFRSNTDFEFRLVYICALPLMFFQLHFSCELENVFSRLRKKSPSASANAKRKAISLEDKVEINFFFQNTVRTGHTY